MLNSYEIASQLRKHIHINCKYELAEVLYNPYLQKYIIYINKDNECYTDLQYDCKIVEDLFLNCVQYHDKYKFYELMSESVNENLAKMNLEELVEYYYKKGKSLAQINTIIIRDER